jgi:hypothetical protein
MEEAEVEATVMLERGGGQIENNSLVQTLNLLNSTLTPNFKILLNHGLF